ncbi:MAG: DUF6600 domain-containing protein [Casimicrobiaceae bacterium]
MHASVTTRALALLTGLILAALSLTAFADPPARVMRLSYTTGSVSFSLAAEPDHWVEARRNRPLFIGDRLWADAGARAELDLGTAVVYAAPRTSVAVLNIDENITQLELVEGRLSVRVRALGKGETFEIDTPNLAFVITAPGLYHVDVDNRGESTVVAIRDGRGEAYGEGRSYLIDRGQWFRFYGTALENDYARLGPQDEFDRWVAVRDSRYDRAGSARYVSRSMIGYADLDEYGTWSSVAEYGNVWFPRTVAADWAPYRTGHWSFVEPWGWTWVDDAPWGFAPFHYGRWARVQDRWGWVPGPVNTRPVYAPALVAFVGGENFNLSVASGPARGIGWFPLAPGEVYRPPYQVSRNYFTQVNVTNTRVENTTVVNVYNNPTAVREVRYRYREAPAAVTAVAINAFIESRPVARSALPTRDVSQVVLAAPVLVAPPVAPSRASVVGASAPAAVKPPEPVERRQAVARSAPPAAPPAFAAPDRNAAGLPNAAAGTPAASAGDTSPARTQAARPRDRVRVVSPGEPATAAATAEHRGGKDGQGRDRELAKPGQGGPDSTPPAAPPAAAGPAPEGGRRGTGAAADRAGNEAGRRPNGAREPGKDSTPAGSAAPPAAAGANAAPPAADGRDRRSLEGQGAADRNRAGRPAAPQGQPSEVNGGSAAPQTRPGVNDRGRAPDAAPPGTVAPPADDGRGRGNNRNRPGAPEAAPSLAAPPVATPQGEGGRGPGNNRNRPGAPEAPAPAAASPSAAPPAAGPPSAAPPGVTPQGESGRGRGNNRSRPGAPEAAPPSTAPPVATPQGDDGRGRGNGRNRPGTPEAATPGLGAAPSAAGTAAPKPAAAAPAPGAAPAPSAPARPERTPPRVPGPAPEAATPAAAPGAAPNVPAGQRAAPPAIPPRGPEADAKPKPEDGKGKDEKGKGKDEKAKDEDKSKPRGEDKPPKKE